MVTTSGHSRSGSHEGGSRTVSLSGLSDSFRIATGGILRKSSRSLDRSCHSSSDDSYDSFASSNTSGYRSRDSSVDSMYSQQSQSQSQSYNNNGGFAMSEHRIPLSGTPRRASLGAVPANNALDCSERSSRSISTSFRFNSLDVSERSNASMNTNNFRVKSKAAIGPSASENDNKPKKTYKTTRRKMTRRASLSDVQSDAEGSVSGHQRFPKAQRRGSLGNETTPPGTIPINNYTNNNYTNNNNTATAVPTNFRPNAKMGRRASMGDSPSIDSSEHSSYRNQELEPIPMPQTKAQTIKLPAASRMGRRASLAHVAVTTTPLSFPKSILRRSSDVSSDNYTSSDDDDYGTSSTHSRRTLSRRGSLNDVVGKVAPTRTCSNHERTMSRRGSLNDVVGKVAPQRAYSNHERTMSRRGSLNDVVGKVAPKRTMSRRGSLNDVVGVAPTRTYSNHERTMSRRGSLNDVVGKVAPTRTYSNHERTMSRRGSLNDVVGRVAPQRAFSNYEGGSMRSMRSMSRRGSLNDVLEECGSMNGSMNGSMSGSMSVSMRSTSRRGSLNDVVAVAPTRTFSNEGSMSQRSSLKAARRSSLSDVVTPSTTTSTTTEPAATTLPPRSILRRGSLSDVTETESCLAPSKMACRASLNDTTAPLTSFNDSSSMGFSSFRLSSVSKSARNMKRSVDTFLTKLQDPDATEEEAAVTMTVLKPATSASSARRSSVSNASAAVGPPVVASSDGSSMAMGYCVPLKSTSERNDRTVLKGAFKGALKSTSQRDERTTLKGKESNDNSPLSRTDRSNTVKKSFRSNRTSNYYNNGSAAGSSMSGSISSIPLDIVESSYDIYNDSMISGIGGRNSVRTMTNRSIYLSDSGTDDSSEDYDSEDNSVGQRLDEMESSTRSGSCIIGSGMDDSGVDESWSVHNLAAEIYQTDMDAVLTPFSDRRRQGKISINIPTASLDNQSNSSNQTGNRDDSIRLDCMESDDWVCDETEPSFHDDNTGAPSSRRGSLQLDQLQPTATRRVSSLAWNDESTGLDASRKSICWEDESLGPAPAVQKRRSSLTWDEVSIGQSKKSLTWRDEDDSLAPPKSGRRSGLEIEVGSDDEDSLGDFGASASLRPSLAQYDQDSDTSLGEFGGSGLGVVRPSLSQYKQDSDTSLGDFGGSGLGGSGILKTSLSRFAKHSSDTSLGDFGGSGLGGSGLGGSGILKTSLSRFAKHSSDTSLGDFGGSGLSLGGSGILRPSISRFPKHSSDTSLGDFGGDDGSSSDESDGLILDDDIFKDCDMGVAESHIPPVFKRRNSSQGRRGSAGDYTLSLSGKGEINDLDRSEKSITFGRMRSISSLPGSAIDNSTRSRAISTISEDSFEITAEDLGASFKPALYPQQLELLRDGDDDEGSYVSCSSEEYASSTEFYDSDDEKEKRVKEGLMWGIGTFGLGAIIGWVVKQFRKRTSESEEDVLGDVDLETIHDELGQSIAQSLLDDSMNFTGTDQLWGWASLGDGGASGELVVGALHVPGKSAAVVAATTSSAAPTTTTAAATAAAAATTNTMAVTAASNVGAVAVTTTAAIGNSAIVTGAGLGAGVGVASAAGVGGAGLAATVGIGGAGGSATAVMTSTLGALALAGTTYYAGSGAALTNNPNSTMPDILHFIPRICPHINKDKQTGIFRLTLDVSGMQGTDEEWGWMPFSDGTGKNSTSSEALKDVWEELFASSYNNITKNGCSELFERRVLNAELLSTVHTGSSEDGSGDAFLETEWEVNVSCWRTCPEEPIFGTELRRILEPVTKFPTEAPVADLDIETADADESSSTTSIPRPSKFFISQLDFRSIFETCVHEAADWEMHKSEEVEKPNIFLKPNMGLGANNEDQEANDEEQKPNIEPPKMLNIVSLSPIDSSFVSNPPTESNIRPPSDQNSESPSSEPTVGKPSGFPTASMNASPSSSPTSSTSTDRPTESPTDFPSQSPTELPTTYPTESPTESRTTYPTESPTKWPTGPPTDAPVGRSSLSFHPSFDPTSLPSDSPSTASPSSTPSIVPSPTDIPIIALYSSPSFDPTSLPSDSPSIVLTSGPSQSPTILNPSSSPTSDTSSSPSESPNDSASASPSESPSVSPSAPPSSISANPSATHSDSPSYFPSILPSSTPSTKLPRFSPSNTPSVTPIGVPSFSPSESPSATPTCSPDNLASCVDESDMLIRQVSDSSV